MTLPKGMALIETADGRWFPALTPLTDVPRLVTVLDAGARCIPPAREAKPTTDQQIFDNSSGRAVDKAGQLTCPGAG